MIPLSTVLKLPLEKFSLPTPVSLTNPDLVSKFPSLQVRKKTEPLSCLGELQGVATNDCYLTENRPTPKVEFKSGATEDLLKVWRKKRYLAKFRSTQDTKSHA